MMRRLVRNVLVAGALLAGMAVGAVAQQDAGHDEYMIACAVCHGESGRGDGPFAGVMNLEVPGLTMLAKQNDGEFPFLKTLMIIDGRTGIRGHGGPMPIWGDRFSDAAEASVGPYGAEVVARGRLLSLVYYLESIQE
jgi:mono/diheme cytochrome c family protein